MKTKNSLLILISLLFCMTDMNAQTRFYDTPRTFYEQGFTYVSHLMSGELVLLNNRNVRWPGTPQRNRDGTDIGLHTPLELQTNSHVQMRQLTHTIVNNTFTPAERQRLRGSRLQTVLYLDTNTGRVDDVRFIFSVRGEFATIPVTTYRRIELELKERIQFVLTDEGRRRNFIPVNVIFEP